MHSGHLELLSSSTITTEIVMKIVFESTIIDGDLPPLPRETEIKLAAEIKHYSPFDQRKKLALAASVDAVSAAWAPTDPRKGKGVPKTGHILFPNTPTSNASQQPSSSISIKHTLRYRTLDPSINHKGMKAK
jgi:hypothetical protein